MNRIAWIAFCAGLLAAQARAEDTPASPPVTAPGANSVQIDGWPIPGTTTVEEVHSKLGRPMVENHMDPLNLGQHTEVFQGPDGTILAFLFDKNDVVVRMMVYAKSP